MTVLSSIVPVCSMSSPTFCDLISSTTSESRGTPPSRRSPNSLLVEADRSRGIDTSKCRAISPFDVHDIQYVHPRYHHQSHGIFHCNGSKRRRDSTPQIYGLNRECDGECIH